MNDLTINRLSLLAAAINAEHRAAYGFAVEAVEHAAECGRLLIEAKALLPHGEWIPWLNANTGVVPRQSQKYMRLASNWEEIRETSDPASSHLTINGALELIADPKPKKARQRCISAAEIGEVTLVFRGWFPNVAPKGGGGPWPSDIADAYARVKIGPPFATLTWQKKAAQFHWSGWENQAPSHYETEEEEEWDENQPDRQDLCEEDANRRDALEAEERPNLKELAKGTTAKNQLNTFVRSANGEQCFAAAKKAADWFIKNAPHQIDMSMVSAANRAAEAWVDLAADLTRSFKNGRLLP